MRVFLESHNLKNPYSGLGQFNYHLIKAFYNLGKSDIEFILNTKNNVPLKKEFGNFFTFHQYRSYSRYPLFAIRRKVDLWHSMNQNTRVEPAYNLPYLTTVHDVNFMQEATGTDLTTRKKQFQAKLNRSAAIVYISDYARKSCQEHFNIPSIPEQVIYNGNPIDEVLVKNNKPLEKSTITMPYLFSIGQVLPKKNFLTLVRMMEFLPNFKLLIAGKKKTAYAEEIQHYIATKKLNTRVQLLGEITEAEKYKHYQDCSAFVFPSLREGFGIPPIEAMYFGKPVFLSDKTSLPEIGGPDAFYWQNFDPEYMANELRIGLSQFKANPTQLAEKLKQRAQHFSWEKAAIEYLKVYKHILHK